MATFSLVDLSPLSIDSSGSALICELTSTKLTMLSSGLRATMSTVPALQRYSVARISNPFRSKNLLAARSDLFSKLVLLFSISVISIHPLCSRFSLSEQGSLGLPWGSPFELHGMSFSIQFLKVRMPRRLSTAKQGSGASIISHTGNLLAPDAQKGSNKTWFDAFRG